MSETINLKYGDREISLEKSDSLIAVKTKPGMEKKLASVVDRASDTAGMQDGSLGGFKIIRLDKTSEQDSNQVLDVLRADPAVAVGSHVFHMSDDGVPFVPTGIVFVEFKDATSVVDQEAALAQQSLQIVEARDQNTFLVRVTPQAGNPVKVASELQKLHTVKIAEPELATPGQVKGFAIPTDSLLVDQWHLENIGRHRGSMTGFKKGADARVIAAWKRGQSVGAPSVVIAVIDDGFDLTHPDLRGPGKVVHPRDFSRGSDDPSPGIDGSDWHGTACAGVATGRAGGGDILGAAPGCSLMPVRWGPNLSDSQVEAWFGYVTARGAWVVSCSWGAQADYFPLSTRISRALKKCATEGRGGHGCVIVFAAGNSNHDINNPPGSLDGFATHPNVIAVSASTSVDARSNYSNYGEEVWVCAPSSGAGGWGILTSDVTGERTDGRRTEPLGYSEGDYFYDFGGTSSACPLVAGICGLVLTADPDLSAHDVRKILQKSARKIGADADYDNGHSKYYGYGCVDADKAVQAALASRVKQPRIAADDAQQTVGVAG